MSDTSLTLEMLIKNGRAIVGLEQQEKATDKLVKTTGKIAGEAKKADAEMERFAKRVQQLHSAPIEQFAGKFNQLETAFAKGKIGLIAYSGAMTKLRTDLAAAQASFDGTAAKLQEQGKLTQWLAGIKTKSAQLEQNEGLRVTREKKADLEKMSAYHASVVTKSAQLEQSENLRLAREVRNLRAAYIEARQERQRTFGPSAIAEIGQLVTSYVSAYAAIGVAKAAFQHLQQEGAAAMGSLERIDPANKDLAQLAIGEKPGTHQRDQARADAAVMKYGGTREAARQILFDLKSFGREGEYESIMAMQPGVDAQRATRLATKVNKMFGDTSSSREIVNMALAAGKPSEANFEQFADAMAAAMEGGSRIASSPEQMFAVLGQTAAYYHHKGEGGGAAGAVLQAGQRAKSYTAHVATRLPQLAGQDIVQIFDAIEALPAAEKKDFFKENIEVGGYHEALRKARPGLETNVADITAARRHTGQPNDLVSQVIQIRKEDPKAQAVMAKERAHSRLEIDRENHIGIDFESAAAASAEMQAAANRNRLNFWQRAGLYAFAGTAANLGMDPQSVKNAGVFGASATTALGGALFGGGSEAYVNFTDNLVAEERARIMTPEARQKAADARRKSNKFYTGEPLTGTFATPPPADSAATEKQEAAADALLRAAQALSEAAANFGGSPTRAIQATAQATLN